MVLEFWFGHSKCHFFWSQKWALLAKVAVFAKAEHRQPALLRVRMVQGDDSGPIMIPKNCSEIRAVTPFWIWLWNFQIETFSFFHSSLKNNQTNQILYLYSDHGSSLQSQSSSANQTVVTARPSSTNRLLYYYKHIFVYFGRESVVLSYLGYQFILEFSKFLISIHSAVNELRPSLLGNPD